MKLQSYQSDIVVQQLKQNLDWTNNFDFTSSQQELQPDTWVHLLELPSTYSFDEALLLCQMSADEWLAWIPDHGEAVLHTSQFCSLSENCQKSITSYPN
jgi:hypothetical protein